MLNFCTGNPPATSPRFQGQKSTQVAQQQLLSGYTDYPKLKQLLRKDSSLYLGQLPDGFSQTLQLSTPSTLSAIDELAEELRATGHPKSQQKAVNPEGYLEFFTHLFSGAKPIEILQKKTHITEIGDGGTGDVYKVTLNDKNYALKVVAAGWLKEPNDFIAFNEVANGLFFNKQGVSDISRLYVSNPFKGWSLMEYIDPQAAPGQRPGKSMAALGYHLDDNKAENYIHGIRVDHGGMVTEVH